MYLIDASARTFRNHLKKRTVALRYSFWGFLATTVTVFGVNVPSAFANGVPAGAHTTSHNSILKRGLAYYDGKTITIVSPAAPATTFDIVAREMAPYLQSYLKASVEVEDISGGATIIGQNAFEHAAPNGLTLGVIEPLLDTEIALSNTPGLSFNPERLAFLQMFSASPSVFITGTESGCPRTFAEALTQSSSSSPPTLMVPTAGLNDLGERALNAAFNLHGTLITGFATAPAQITGLIDHDGCITELPLSSAGPLIKEGVAAALTYYGKLRSGLAYTGTLAGVPSVAQLIKQYGSHYKSKSERTAQKAIIAFAPDEGPLLVAQTSTSSAELTALRAAAVYTLEQPGFQDAMLNEGINPAPLTGPAKGAFISATNAAKPIAGILNS